MAQNPFKKATDKMFSGYGGFSSGIQIAEPSAGEQRVTREELESEVKENQPAVETGSHEGQQESQAQQPQVVAQAPAEEERQQGRGRPLKDPGVEKYVLMNFRVSADFRQKFKVMAAEQGRSITELFEEGMQLLFGKYGVE